MSTEYAGAAATPLNIDDTETASKRLNDAVTTFMALKTLPVQDTDCLHDVIVAIHAMCGALNVAMLAGIDESAIAECVAPAKELAGESPFVANTITQLETGEGIYMDTVDSYFGDLGGAGSVADDEVLNMLGYWNQLWDRCKSGDVVSSVYETADAMLRVKRKFNDAEKWRAFAQGEQFAGLRLALREDPFSNRAVTRPRGYPGDAVLLDMAYRIVGPTGSTSTLGKMAFEATTNSPGSRSVRARKLCVAKFIDSVAAEIDKPRIVSVACGHLRELDCSRAFAAGKVGTFLGVDQDSESIAVVEKNFGSRGVIARCATLKDFLQQKVDLGPFHGVYSVGLFDYLDDATAAKATAAMFRMVAPGGRLLIANLAPSLGDIAYMEAVMDWWMIYRSESQLADITKKVVGTESADIRTFADVLGNVTFAEIRRKAA